MATNPVQLSQTITNHEAAQSQALTDLVRPGTIVTVLGIGSHGGGLGAIRWLVSRRTQLRVVDDAPAERLTRSLQALKRYLDPDAITWHLGGASCDVLRNCNLLVVNPAVRPEHPLVQEALKVGIPVTTEIGLFLTYSPGQIVGITGTNGKTTTTLATYRILKYSARRAWLGGNLGISLLPRLPLIREDDVVVLELSSFQLFWLASCARTVQISAVTSFAPDHLDWHPSLDHYRDAKGSLLRRTSLDGVCVLNAADDAVRTWTGPARTVYAGSEEAHVAVAASGIRVHLADRHETLPWPDHLRDAAETLKVNFTIATAAALAAGGNLEGVARALETTRPVQHRLQSLGSVCGRAIVDDSAATSPHATMQALRWATARWPHSVWLILGGRSKGQDYRPLLQFAAATCRGVALLGENRRKLLSLLPRGTRLAVKECDSLEQAVRWCFESSRKGDLILCSPASASTDMFRDYRQRGRTFQRLVRSLQQQSRSCA